MKVQIREKERTFQIVLPTKLVFSRFVLRLVLKNVSVNGKKLQGLSPEVVNTLSGEISRIKDKHGSWELVEVRSADGEQVKVIL